MRPWFVTPSAWTCTSKAGLLRRAESSSAVKFTYEPTVTTVTFRHSRSRALTIAALMFADITCSSLLAHSKLLSWSEAPEDELHEVDGGKVWGAPASCTLAPARRRR